MPSDRVHVLEEPPAPFARVQLNEVPAEAARSSGGLALWRSHEREAMGALLSTFPWRVYCTWTFRDRIGESGALREVQRWLQLLSFGFGQEVGWMVGLEQDHGALWPHAHGLVCGQRVVAEATLYRGKDHERTVPLIEPYWRAWMDRHGQGAFRVIDGRGGRGCSFYCAKYATKRGQITFSANLERFRGSAPALERFTLFPEVG